MKHILSSMCELSYIHKCAITKSIIKLFQCVCKKFSTQHFVMFFLTFLRKYASTFHANCQSLFSGKNKKNVINLLPAIFAQRVMKITFGYDTMSVNL